MMRISHLPLLLASIAAATTAHAAITDVADAAMRGDHNALRAAIARKADVNATQADGSTALHWAVERDDMEAADLMIKG